MRDDFYKVTRLHDFFGPVAALTLGVVPLLYSLLFRVSFRDFRYED